MSDRDPAVVGDLTYCESVDHLPKKAKHALKTPEELSVFILCPNSQHLNEIKDDATAFEANISETFTPHVTHIIVANSLADKFKAPDAFWNQITGRWPSISLRCNASNNPMLSSAVVAKFTWPEFNNFEQLVYVVSESWIKDCRMMEYRLSEANYASIPFCTIFANTICSAMKNMLDTASMPKVDSDNFVAKTLDVIDVEKCNAVEQTKQSVAVLRDEPATEPPIVTGVAVIERVVEGCNIDNYMEAERSRPESELEIPSIGDWVETKSTHEDSQIFRARVIARWQASGKWYFRLKSPDIGATYVEPLKNVRTDNIWSTTQLLELGRGRRSRRSSKSGCSVSEPAETKRSSVTSMYEAPSVTVPAPPPTVMNFIKEDVKALEPLPECSPVLEIATSDDGKVAESLHSEFVAIENSQSKRIEVNSLQNMCKYKGSSQLNELLIVANRMLPSTFPIQSHNGIKTKCSIQNDDSMDTIFTATVVPPQKTLEEPLEAEMMEKTEEKNGGSSLFPAILSSCSLDSEQRDKEGLIGKQRRRDFRKVNRRAQNRKGTKLQEIGTPTQEYAAVKYLTSGNVEESPLKQTLEHKSMKANNERVLRPVSFVGNNKEECKENRANNV